MAVTNVRIVSKSGEYVPGDCLYTTVYEVSCAAADSITTVLSASSGGVTIPTRGTTTHPDDAQAICTHVGPARQLISKDFAKWEVPCKYARYHLGDSDEDIRQPDPLDDAVQVDFGVRLEGDWAVDEDALGATVVNSVGDEYDPPVFRPRAVFTIKIVRNEATFPTSDALTYSNTVNAASFTLAGLYLTARQCWCEGITGGRRERNGTTYWPVSYEFAIRADTWDVGVVDQGLYYLNAGVRTPIPDGVGSKTQTKTPMRLDGSGGILASGIEFTTWRLLTEKNFGALGLGSV